MPSMTITRKSGAGLRVGPRTDGTPIRRPLSPHLQVYDMMQLTSALSIGGRITGAVWSVGLVILVWWRVPTASGPSAYAAVTWFLTSWLGVLGLVGLTAAAWFHPL